jgi:hypothetical protein
MNNRCISPGAPVRRRGPVLRDVRGPRPSGCARRNRWTAVLVTLLAAAGLAGGETRRAVFEGAGAEHTWQIRDLDPDLPADWSGYGFLVLELRLSSPQRFELRVHDAQGVRSVRLSPLPGAWVRGAVPLGFLTQPARQGNDMAAVYNKARPMMWINLTGAPGPLTSVRELGVALPNPVGSVTLEIRSVKLAKEDPGDALLEPQPLVDQFGQWIHDEWPGKAATLDELKASWAAEEKALGAGGFDYCKYGGYQSTKARATGFFRVEKIDGKWWFVDPDGHLFLSLGSDSIGTSVATATQGREQLFAALPPPDAGGRSGASFYTWNLARRWGADWSEKWIDLTARRLAAWGFNTIGNWSDQRLANAHRTPYVYTSRGWGETGPMGIADVYAPDFAGTIDRAAAEQCDARKDDPYLLGYFLGNEPPWPGRESVAVDAILAGRPSPMQQELRKFLAAGDTPERRRAFLYEAYRRFVETVTAAIRKHDPNHLSLGLRFGSTTPVEIVRLSKVFDVYSLNNYAYAVNPAEIAKVRAAIDRPILIGEFHFGVPGRGMPPGLKQTANQEERGVAYRFYVENAMADPSVVGAHWFEWIDEPSTGRNDGENYNIGMVDVTDRPYRELVDAARTTHSRLMAVHSGKEPAVTRQARVQ